MLIPWIVFWVAVPIHREVGGLVCIAVCVLAQLLFYRHKKTIYDYLTGVLVAGCSMAVLKIPISAGNTELTAPTK